MKQFKTLGQASRFSWVDIPENCKVEDNEEFKKLKELMSESFKRENVVCLLAAGASKALTLEDGKTAPLMVDIFKKIKEEIKSYESVKTKVNYNDVEEDFERFLSRCVYYLKINKDGDVENFLKEAKKIISNECNFLTPSSGTETFEMFLRKLCTQNQSRNNRPKIFTLNYDLSIEQSSSKIGVTLFDGFSFSYPFRFNPTYFDYDLIKKDDGDSRPASNVLHLYKIHGSLNWQHKGGDIIKKDDALAEPLLIFPTKDKFEHSYAQPFIEMITRFKDNLRKKSTTLVVVGYSCGDEHINSIIQNALQLNFDLKIIFIDKVITTNSKFNVFKKMASEINDSRLTFVETVFENFVANIMPEGRSASREDQLLNAFSVIQKELQNEG